MIEVEGGKVQTSQGRCHQPPATNHQPPTRTSQTHPNTPFSQDCFKTKAKQKQQQQLLPKSNLNPFWIDLSVPKFQNKKERKEKKKSRFVERKYFPPKRIARTTNHFDELLSKHYFN